MKSSLLISLGLVPLFASPLMAADLPVKSKAPPPPAPYNWTGCYVGAHFGSLFLQKDWGPLGSHDGTGLVGGGQLGCNYQISPTWVIGIQGDLATTTDSSGTNVDQATRDPVTGLVGGFTDQSKAEWISSVTGRVGYAWDRLLTYAKGGGAWTHDKYDILFPDNSTFASASETRSGWTVGAGFEYAITNNFTMFFEYNYYDFGTKTVGFTSVTGATGLVDIRERESLVKVGANWKFGW